MVRQSKLLLPLVLVALFAAAAWVPRAEAEVTVSFGVFYDGLAPYGSWTSHPRLGMVWSPDVAVGWRPYSDGHWIFAAGEGWTWIGDEPWAWAPYHYGNWYYDPVAGWLWVPGYAAWEPAVVEWAVADNWIGWAPRPPRAAWIAGPRILPAHYTFVEPRFFVEPLLPRYILPVDRNVEFLSVARPVRVVDVDWVERIVTRPVERVRIVEVAGPTALRAGWNRGAVRLFRPRIDRRAGLGPPAGQRLAKLERSRAHDRIGKTERLRKVDRRAFIEDSGRRRARELRAVSRTRDRSHDRSVVVPRGRGHGEERLTGHRVERRSKVERSAPPRHREQRASGRMQGGGGGGRKVDRVRGGSGGGGRKADRARGGGGGGGRRFDRAPQRQHAARGGGGRGGGGRGGGGKKGGGKP